MAVGAFGRACALLLAVLLALPSVAPGQTAGAAAGSGSGTAADREGPVTLEQRAGDLAFTRLVDEIMSLRMAFPSKRSLSETLATAPGAERHLRELIWRQHLRSPARTRVDGAVAVDAILPTSQLERSLQDISNGLANPQLKGRLALEAGTRPTLVATGAFIDEGLPMSDRPGWRHVTEARLALAMDAANVDWRRHLMVRLSRLALPERQLLGELFQTAPRFQDEVRRKIEAMTLPPPMVEAWGLTRQSASFSRREVIGLLQAAARDANLGGEVDFSRMVDPALQVALVVEGYGTAPPDGPSGGSSP